MSTSTCNLKHGEGGGGSGLDYVILLSEGGRGLGLDYGRLRRGGGGGGNKCQKIDYVISKVIYIQFLNILWSGLDSRIKLITRLCWDGDK